MNKTPTPIEQAEILLERGITDKLYEVLAQTKWLDCSGLKRPLFHYEAVLNDTVLMDKLMRAGVDVNAKGAKGKTPLHLACRMKNKEAIEFLLKVKANPNALDESYQTPLHEIILDTDTGNEKKMLPFVEMLIAAGARPDYDHSRFYIKEGSILGLCMKTGLKKIFVSLANVSRDLDCFYKVVTGYKTVPQYYGAGGYTRDETTNITHWDNKDSFYNKTIEELKKTSKYYKE